MQDIWRAHDERAGQLAPSGLPGNLAQYAFLLDRCVDEPTLIRAAQLAGRWGVAPHSVMISLGWVQEADYVRELASHWGLPVAEPAAIEFSRWNWQGPDLAVAFMAPRLAAVGGRLLVLEATSEPPGTLASRITRSRMGWPGCALAGRRAIESAWQLRFGPRMLEHATVSLRQISPHASAATDLTARQVVRGSALTGLLMGTLLVAPEVAIPAWTMALTLPFLLVVIVRLLAVIHVLGAGRIAMDAGEPADRLGDDRLPVYTLLVPLYGEAHMLAHLLTALQKIDYPAARLDVKIVLEASDPQTLAAAAVLELPGHVSIVVVPDGAPRTKPKALNYALQLARGEIVAIFDAEDAPEPDQLREAVAAFRALPPEVACLQARLNIHNLNAGWLSRQFTLEYCALFDGLLPCLARLGLPLPLGGTSNHFRKEALIACGAWDPFNVTEDADLGLRLHRMGWRTGVIASTTYEEAPERLRDWLPQRTRWLKGWMQTYLVHSKPAHDRALPSWRPDLPAWSRADGRIHTRVLSVPHPREAATWPIRITTAVGVHVLLGGLLLSILVHPLFYVLVASELVSGRLFGRPESLMGAGFWHIAIADLAIGFVASLALSGLTAWRRSYRALVLRVVMLPLYWLLISFAGYRALWQLVRDPFRWEKTAHGKHPSASA